MKTGQSEHHQQALTLFLTHNSSASKTISLIECLLTGDSTQSALAKRFDVSRGYITHLKKRYGV
jgi:Trp operon repressor